MNSRRVWICALVLMQAMNTSTWALSLPFTTDDLGGGLFQYNLVLINSDVSEPLSGLNILEGFSVFGLTPLSVINAPQNVGGNPAANWSFFAPDPTIGANELNYFSLDHAGDVPIGGSLGGFSFQSTTNPSTIGAIQFDVIGGLSAQQIPEPTTLLLLGTGLAILAGKFSGQRRAPRTKLFAQTR